MENKLLYFISGIITGAVGGSIIMYFREEAKLKKILDNLENDIVDDMYTREYFEDEATEVNPVNDRENGPLTPEKREEIKEKLLDNLNRTTDYASKYQAKEPDPDEIKKHEELYRVAEIENEPDDEIEEETKAMMEEHREHINDAPELISVEEFSNLPPGIETKALYFYNYDETLADDEDNLIEDPDTFIGDILEDFIDSDDEMIFVRNYQLDTAYEIHRVMGSWRNDTDGV